MPGDDHREADIALSKGDLAGAIAALERLLATTADDFAGWMKLAALRRGAKQPRFALDAVNAALDTRPNDFMGLLLKGSLHEQLGEPLRAAEVYRAVVHHASEWPALPPQVAQQVEHARGFLEKHRRAVDSQLLTDRLDEVHRKRAQRFRDNVLDRRPVFHQEPTHYRYPDLADIEFFDSAYPAFQDRLRAAAPAILEEYTALAAAHGERQKPYVDFAPGQPVGQWGELNRSTAWNAFHLLRYGERDPVNAPACPETLAAFVGEEQADIPGLGPNLMFSLLAPHTHIPAHHGVANFRVVCHLPLVVPAGCRFRVGAETRVWRRGEPWIFDDTIEHEAWNDSDELRVVLIGDLWRPELDREDRAIVCNLLEAQELVGSSLGTL